MPTLQAESHEHEHRYHYGGMAHGHELPKCRRPKWMCCNCGHRQLVRCRSGNERACPPCSETYRRAVLVIAGSGYVRADREAVVFLTLTAPGDRQHTIRAGVACPCTPPGGIDLARWNGEAVHNWNRLRQAIERSTGVRFSYFKAAEVQERGALHLHVIARFERPVILRKTKLRYLAMRHGFGHAIDVQAVRGDKVAAYVAKYVTKATTERRRVPYCHRRTGELGPGRWRAWSSARSWGMTMCQVRRAQERWARLTAAQAEADTATPAGAAGLLIPRPSVTHVPGRGGP